VTAVAADLVAPIDEGRKQPAETAGEPPERAPQATRGRAAAVTKTKPTHRLRPGDLVCGECGEGNPPTRKFCSRCGTSLLQAEVVKVPWWRRLRIRRGPRVVAVASRPGEAGAGRPSAGHDARHTLTKAFRKVRVLLGAVIMVGIVAYGVYSPFRGLVNGKVESIKNKITGAVVVHFVPVHAIAETANLQERGHPGFDAVDSFLNTYWLAPFSANDYPTLTLTFASPVTLKRMIIYSGASNSLAHGRPSLLVLVFSNNKSTTLTPQDTPKEQTLSISNAEQVQSVKIEIEGTYRGAGRSDVAISDIELFALEIGNG
jgi:hypothetical protein